MKYSVVVPVYYSEESLAELFQLLSVVFNELGVDFEVIFVDDGSPDNSWEVIKKLKAENPGNITAIRLSQNYGQHNATFCGLSFAKGDFVITIDDDLQTPPQEIRKLIRKYEETQAEVVYGIYPDKKHSSFRNVGSTSFKKSSKLLHNAPGEGSSFRLMTADLVKKILNHPTDFVYLDEILTWYTQEIAFEEVLHMPRKYKDSGYTPVKLFGLAANILLYYTMIPLKFLVYGGLTISLLTLIYGAYFIVKKLAYDVPLGYTSLIVAILFSTSIILFSLGVIGEYLRRIYQIQNRKPPYSIRRIL
jgi:undecaprenyl-phosphate 4-deoxy-4-formamido-L-arabinose transferase